MSRRWAVAVVLSFLVVGAMVTVWSAFERSTIPVAIDGEIAQIAKRHGKLGGSDDVWQLWLRSGEIVTVDHSVAASLDEGQLISKAAWSTTIRADGTEVALSVAADVWRASLAGLVAVAAGAWSLRRSPLGRRPSPQVDS